MPVASCVGATSDKYYQPKYAAPVSKLLIGRCNLGKIVFARGLDLGPKFDGKMWIERGPWKRIKSTDPRHAFLMDGAFSGKQQCIAPARKPPNVALPKAAQAYNDPHGFHQSSIRQLFGYAWQWAIMRNIYPCKEEAGEHAFEKRLHVFPQNIAFVLRRKWHFAPYGPWPHTPADAEQQPADVEEDVPADPGVVVEPSSGPAAGTNTEEGEVDPDSCEEFEESWADEYVTAQARRTRSQGTVLLPRLP